MKHRVSKRLKNTVAESRVISDELQQLKSRRKEAFGKDEDTDSISDSRVGVALSGGGVRSGAFGLGFLQGLIGKRFLPFVDYLSTVSGGGYAGCFLSSYALKHGKTDDNTGLNTNNGEATQAFGAKPKRILQLVYSVDYLKHLGEFLNRSVFGSLLVLTVGISGLVLVTALAAWSYQWVNARIFRYAIYVLGFRSDVTAALLPPAICLMFWALIWLVDYMRRGSNASGGLARPFLYLSALTVPIAVALLMGTGDISLESLPAWFGYSVDGIQPQHWTRPLIAAFSGALIAALLPYLRPNLLIKSGINPRSTFERASFWFATRALVFGLPLLLVGFFARENISGKNTRRSAVLKVRNEVVGWKNWRSDASFLTSLNSDPILLAAIWNKPYRVRGKYQPGALETAGTGNQFTASDLGTYEARLETPDGFMPEVDLLCSILNRNKTELTACESTVTCGDLLGELESILQYETMRIEKLAVTTNLGAAWINLLSWPMDGWLRQTSDVQGGTRRQSIERLISENWKKQESELSRNPFVELIQRRKRVYQIKTAMLAPINSRLRDKDFYEAVKPAYNPNLREALLMIDKSPPPDIKKSLEEARRASLALARVTEAQENCQQNEPSGSGNAGPGAAAPTANENLAKKGTSNENTASKNTSQVEIQRARFQDVVRANRNLLGHLAGGDLHPAGAVYANYVWKSDQALRLKIVFWAGIIFLISGFAVDLNATSIHRYYSQRLAEAWIEPMEGVGKRIPLALMDTVSRGYPYHLLTGSVYMLGRRNREDYPEPFDYFLFSHRYCGSERTTFEETKNFMDGKYGLDDAMAISGAAVSILHLTKNPLLTIILFSLNFRLGQWIGNPGHRTVLPNALGRLLTRFAPISPIRVLLSLVQKAEERDLCFVADGGFFDNLGIDSLIRRRCKVIFALDAGADKNSEFGDLMRLIRYARMKHHTKIENVEGGGLPLDVLVPDAQSNQSQQHFFVAKISYPEGTEGLLVYVKSSITGDEADELLQYKRRNPEFPHDSTADQAFLPEKFESYRMLGNHIAESVLTGLDFDATRSFDVSQFVDCLHQHYGLAEEAKGDLERLFEAVSSPSPDQRRHALARLQTFSPNTPDEAAELMLLASSSLVNQGRDQFDRTQMARQILHDRCGETQRYIADVLKSSDSAKVRAAISCTGWYLEMGEPIANDIRHELMHIAKSNAHRASSRVAAIRVLKKHHRELGSKIVELLNDIAENEPLDRVARAANL